MSEARKKANKKWNQNNKERIRYLNARSAARGFIRNKATADDLDELLSLIDERKKQLEIGN
ncbi:hypothetical protein [Ligilactobacillus sp. LYQ60]|uniref:hypothetical protein n=1 Tax=Ligilactobacillus sp. LYQ60 TaxID=3378799 RepID=UPI003853E19C